MKLTKVRLFLLRLAAMLMPKDPRGLPRAALAMMVPTAAVVVAIMVVAVAVAEIGNRLPPWSVGVPKGKV